MGFFSDISEAVRLVERGQQLYPSMNCCTAATSEMWIQLGRLLETGVMLQPRILLEAQRCYSNPC